MSATLGFIVAMFVTMLLVPPLMILARRAGIVDVPDARKVHATPIPRIGGLAMISGTVLPLLLWAPWTPQVLWFLAGVGVLAGFGLWDDRTPLDFRLKFVGQLLAIACVVGGADLLVRSLPLLGELPAWVAVPFTVFAMLGVINAINLADGLDGLAGGSSFISVAGIAVLAFAVNDQTLLMLCTVVLGGILGFLRFNTHPAQVFMGDAGSQFLGFSLAVLVIMLTQHSNASMSPVAALLLLGLPLVDTFLVMGQRVAEGRSPFKPDKNHIHHRLLGLGFAHYEAVTVIYLLQTLMVISGVLLRYESDLVLGVLFALICSGVLLLIGLASGTGWRAQQAGGFVWIERAAKWFERVRGEGTLERAASIYVVLAVPAVVAWSIARVSRLPADTLVVLVVLLALATGSLLWARDRRPLGLVERLLACILIIAALYHGSSPAGDVAPSRILYEVLLYGSVALANVAIYKLSRTNPFRINTMDFLVVFGVMGIPGLMSLLSLRENLAEVAAKALVLYYGTELVMANFESRRLLIRGALMGLLALFVLHGGLVA